MKAILHTQCGPPDELQLSETPKPVPEENQMLGYPEQGRHTGNVVIRVQPKDEGAEQHARNSD